MVSVGGVCTGAWGEFGSVGCPVILITWPGSFGSGSNGFSPLPPDPTVKAVSTFTSSKLYSFQCVTVLMYNSVIFPCGSYITLQKACSTWNSLPFYNGHQGVKSTLASFATEFSLNPSADSTGLSYTRLITNGFNSL